MSIRKGKPAKGTGSRAAKPSPGGVRSAAARPRRSWTYGKGPIFRFVGLFVLLLGAFYAITFIPVVSNDIIPAYLRWNARASTFILNVFGENASARDTSVSSARNSVNIRHGCDAIEPSALFLAAVLAFPAAFKSKLPGLIAGTLILAIINLVRIVSLFYVGIFKQEWFDFMHEDFWQPLFILLALSLWIAWAMWAMRTSMRRTRPAEPAGAVS